jgi:hypothetical protein
MTAVPLLRTHAQWQPINSIFKISSYLGRTAANGARILVSMLLVVTISSASNGREMRTAPVTR